MNRKQKSIAISIIEIEYMTLSTCAKEKLWITQFFRNLNFIKYFEIELNQITIIQNDKHEICSSMQFLKNNQIVNLLIKNAHIHERSKHIDVVYHNIKNLYQKNLIQLNYVSNANMIVDNLIKSLSKNKFKKFVKQLKLKKSKIN